MSAEQQSTQSDSGISTRKRMRAATPLHTATSEVTMVAMALEAAIQEIRLIREEQQQQRAAFDVPLPQRDEEIRRMERNPQPHDNQLSPSVNRVFENTGANNAGESDARAELGFKLKPDTFDGTVPLREFFSQLNLIARANHWSDATKTVALAASLRGKARTVLETVQDVSNLEFAELKSKLELRFGEGHLSQNFYTQLTNRKQKFGEDLAALGSELERCFMF